MDKKASKILTASGIVLVFAAVFFAGFFAGRKNRENEYPDIKKDTAVKEAAESQEEVTEPSILDEVSPEAVTFDAHEEEAEDAFIELTEDNSIVNTTAGSYTYDDMVEDMYALCGKYPDLLQYYELGLSFDGRPLYSMTMGDYNAPHCIMAVASLGGSEYLTSMLVMKMIEYYCYYHDSLSYEGVPFSELFDNTCVRVIMMANPDGVTIAQQGIDALGDQKFKDIVLASFERDKWCLEYVEDENGKRWVDHYDQPEFNVYLSDNPRMITFDEYIRMWNSDAYGIELNRNFDADWSSLFIKEEPSYTGYKGPGIVSEVETALVYSYALEREHDFYLSYVAKDPMIDYPDDSGTFYKWVEYNRGGESIKVECGNGAPPFSHTDYENMYEKNRDSWAHLAYTILVNE